MDMFDGFVFLEEKKKSLIPILCQYDFLSALTAAFSITSWRKNRGAQESCLALNSAMVENTEWGRKTIFTPNDLEEFFQLLYPIALYAWKNNYEHLFSSEVEVLLKESGCEYAKHDVDLRREDRRGNHPTIDVLGDYDVIGLNTTQKRIFIIECKVLQPIGSVFEHSNQQKRFFTKEKFDEKFQKRIDYFSKVAMSFFANHGYDTEGFTINPYMVVNKVFSSYYKHVQFPIVTFDELKREIQL